MNCKYGIIAPSHMTTEMLRLGNSEDLFDDICIYSISGLANWSQCIVLWIEKIAEMRIPVIWMVSDVFFNNDDIYELQKLDEGTLFLPGVRGKANNIVDHLRTIDNCIFLSNHTMKVIDYLIDRFPNIKLCFWCLYMRTKCRTSNTYPIDHQYESMRLRYPNNAIDIDWYLQSHGLKFEQCVRDEGGHPNRAGYLVLKKMFETETAR